MTYPPRPNNISIPAVVAGNILQNDDTSISAIDSGYDGAIVMKTQNKLAMLINPDQKVSINTEATNSIITINNDLSTTSTIRLSYQDSYYFDGRITSNGNVLFIPSCDDRVLDPNLITAFRKNFDISDHNGMNAGFHLGGFLVTASASELNYVDVPAGMARANRALVLDELLSITGINRLDAGSLSGTILTPDQPNITTLDKINITTELRIKGDILDVDPHTLRYLNVINEGIAYASKAVILDTNRNFNGINRLTATTIVGLLASGPQPNITSLSALTALTNNGSTLLNGDVTIGGKIYLKYSDIISSSIATNISGDIMLQAYSNKIKTDISCDLQILSHNGTTSGLILGSTLVTSTATQLNYVDVDPGQATGNKALVLDWDRNITNVNQINATYLVGRLQTGSQPMITSVQTLNIIDHNGTTGLALNGIIVTSSANQLNTLNTTNGIAQPNKAMVTDNSKNILGLGHISAFTLSGIIQSPIQPNITTVNTLHVRDHNGITGLMLSGTLVTVSADDLNRLSVTQGIGANGKAVVLDNLKNISGINILSAVQLSGTLNTPNQPNITSVSTLNITSHNGGTSGLSLNGTLITATASQINKLNVAIGTAEPNKAIILDSSLSIVGINVINANVIGGIITSPTQLNIKQLGSINIMEHNGSTSGLSLNSTLVTSSADQLNYVNVRQGIAETSKALVCDSTRSISNIRSLSSTDIYGTIQTANQPYINSVSSLNIANHNGTSSGLSLNGVLVAVNAEQLNKLIVTDGVATASKTMILNSSKDIVGINTLSATILNGTIGTGTQPNISTVNTLNIVNHNGTTGLALNGTIVTASAVQLNRIATTVGLASEGKALILDNNRNISNINSLSANSLTGVIQTGDQPNITTISTLNITNHDGGTDGLRLRGTLVTSSASQLNYNAVVPGAATSFRSMVTNEYNSISGINTLSATKLVASDLELSGVISNFNTGNVIIKSYSFADLTGRMVDIQLLSSFNFTNFQPNDMPNGYSCEIIGYIKSQYSESHTFYVTCNDRVRMWVNGELIIHSWVKVAGSRTSTAIFINAEQWIPFYIQYQVDTGNSPMFLLEWSSNSISRSQIQSNNMAWDNNQPAVSSKHYSQNSLCIYNTSTAGANTAKLSVDTGGDLTIDASGNDIILGSADSINIPAHDGSTKGLYLGGVLVKPTAYEMNYLKVSPGIVSASQALVVDASKSISGINSITATSLACDNLTTNAFTISNLTLSGPLNNYNTGSLLIRQFTGSDVSGRVVNVSTIGDIFLNNYDPRELNTNFSLDIIGYILPTFTEIYRFYAIANDRVRIWVNNTLIMNVWDLSDGSEYTSDSIQLTANQWTPIYIQFQNVSGSSSLQVKWSSTSLIKSLINSSNMAWDNTMVRPFRALSCADQFTLFNTSSGLKTIQTATISVDSVGAMNIASKSGSVSIVSGTNFNIVGHNGTKGLQLAGALVTSTATELNYLTGVTPGSTSPLKALVLDSSKSLIGISSISSSEITGIIKTSDQPFVTSLGTLSSTLKSTADVVISNSNILRFASDSNACYINAGSSITTNSAADVFIGNYNTTPLSSTRKFMIKNSGFVGIQTIAPAKPLTINGAGSSHCMRLVQNSNDGTETTFCDIGVDNTSSLVVNSNIVFGSSGSAALTVNNGILKVTPSGGSVQIGNATSNSLPLEVGSAMYTLTSQAGYVNSSGSMGVMMPNMTAYSLRTTSSIIVNGTVCVTSDRRLKKNIIPLAYDECRKFIMDSKCIRFNYTNDPFQTQHCGLIAQDVAKTQFANIVNVSPYNGINEEVDSDGYISPKDAVYNVSYEEIVPVIMTSVKEVLRENEELKSQLFDLKQEMNKLVIMLHSIINTNQ